MPLRVLVLLFLLVFPSPARGDDWPQWLGPRRDGVWREQGTPDALPKAPPPVRWRVPVAGGYAGPAVAAGRVFVTDFKPADPKQPKSGVERVHCLDEKTGRPLWTHEYAAEYSIDYPAGPRATPAVDGDRVYTLGAEGHLLCLDVATGKPIWSKHFADDGAPTPIWGHAAHPLIDGDKLICLTGPAPGGKLVTAFDKRTGKTLWTALKGKEIGYCPPTMIESQARASSSSSTPNPSTPSTPKPARSAGPTRSGPSSTASPSPPRATSNIPPSASSCSSPPTGTARSPSSCPRRPARSPPSSGTHRPRPHPGGFLHSLMAPPLVTPTHLYGMNRGGELRCLDLATGDVLWETYAATTGDAGHLDNATAFLIPNPGPEKTFLFNESGEMILARLSPEGYEEVGRTKLLHPTNTAEQRPCCGATRRWRTGGCTGGTTGRSCASTPWKLNDGTQAGQCLQRASVTLRYTWIGRIKFLMATLNLTVPDDVKALAESQAGRERGFRSLVTRTVASLVEADRNGGTVELRSWSSENPRGLATPAREMTGGTRTTCGGGIASRGSTDGNAVSRRADRARRGRARTWTTLPRCMSTDAWPATFAKDSRSGARLSSWAEYLRTSEHAWSAADRVPHQSALLRRPRVPELPDLLHVLWPTELSSRGFVMRSRDNDAWLAGQGE